MQRNLRRYFLSMTTPIVLAACNAEPTTAVGGSRPVFDKSAFRPPQLELTIAVDSAGRAFAIEPRFPEYPGLSQRSFRPIQKGEKAERLGQHLAALRSAYRPDVVSLIFVSRFHRDSARQNSGSDHFLDRIAPSSPRFDIEDWQIQYPVDWESEASWTENYTSQQIAEITAPIIAEIADIGNSSIYEADSVSADMLANDTAGVPDPYLDSPPRQALAAPGSPRLLRSNRQALIEFSVVPFAEYDENDPCIDQRENQDLARAAVALVMTVGPAEIVLGGPLGSIAAWSEMFAGGLALRVTTRQLERCKSRNTGPGKYYQKRGSW